FKIDNAKAATLPVCHRLFRAKTIEIDRDINASSSKGFNKFVKVPAPVIPQNGAATFSIFCRTLVRPGMHFENACSLRAAISENLVRPPALKIPATPNGDTAHLRKFQRAIDPTAATPFRWAHIPIWMIVEGNKCDRVRDSSEPERSQIMEITGAVKQKQR